jgi:deoxyribonuclease-4
MRVGVHCSVRKGFVGALEEAAALGCQTLQIFTHSPRGWKTRVYEPSEFSAFRDRNKTLKLGPLVVHSPYLPNLCTSDDLLFKRSIDALKADLSRCAQLEAPFLVVHPGAFSPDSTYEVGIARIRAALNEALSAVPGSTRILIENMAGGGRRVGGTFKEMADIINGVDHPDRIGVCFDTCHAYGAGYDVSTEAGVLATMNEFDKELGIKRIFAFHVNDSKGALGSHRDLHQHLGKGYVGLTGLKVLFSRPEFSGCAFILETPKDTPRADLENLKKLRSCLPTA